MIVLNLKQDFFLLTLPYKHISFFLKIARISTTMIQTDTKLSEPYQDNTGVVLVAILYVLYIPDNANEYQVC
jgi:hypothetical protein